MDVKTTGKTCDTCAAPLVSSWERKKATPEQWAEAKARGWRRALLPRRCEACTKRLRRVPTGNVVPLWVAVAEWRFLHDSGQLNRGETRAQRIRQAAPRIGMTPTALEKALERAQVAA